MRGETRIRGGEKSCLCLSLCLFLSPLSHSLYFVFVSLPVSLFSLSTVCLSLFFPLFHVLPFALCLYVFACISYSTLLSLSLFLFPSFLCPPLYSLSLFLSLPLSWSMFLNSTLQTLFYLTLVLLPPLPYKTSLQFCFLYFLITLGWK